MARTPVLFVPGICGSFNLGVLLDWHSPTLNGWSFPPFVDYGKNFVVAFVKAGYTLNQDLFVAFYDWRKSVRDSAQLYLKPWIDQAKQRAGTQQVVLVGHSMGGLVARSYIQSKAYTDDVAALITLGTPQRGSAQAYYIWGGGEIKGDATMQTVFSVYLWYLRHAHPLQTELNYLKAIRTLIPSVRDLLPIDDYLLAQTALKAEDRLVERNLVVDLLNQPSGLATLVGRVPVTTMAGVGFSTVTAIAVDAPPAPPSDPVIFPDGQPVSDNANGDGDGTVMRSSAQIEHPQVSNASPFPGVDHNALPNHPAVLSQIFGMLGVVSPVIEALPPPEPRLVIMTASPVTLRVESPGGVPLTAGGVLGASREGVPVQAQRARVVPGKNHGHSGKHLNIAVIPRPTAGIHRVHLTGTATGSFALGAMLVSAEGVTLLGGGAGEAAGASAPPVSTITPVATHYGQVAAGTELFYEVEVQSLEVAPTVRLDAPRTTADAVTRLRGAVGGAVLGAGDEGADPVDVVLGGATDPTTQLDALSRLVEQLVGMDDPALAEALIVQLQAAKG